MGDRIDNNGVDNRMTDGDAILAGIIADPLDDLPRLMLADWLDNPGESGERCDPTRAEMIRLSVHVAQLDLPDGRCEPDCPCGGAGNRVAELVSLYGDEWLPKFSGEQHGDLQFTWRRGFPHGATCAAGVWLRFADAITAVHPIRIVTFTTRLDWRSENYDAVLFPHDHRDHTPRRLCKPMHPDEIDRALAEGIDVVLKHEWPGVKVWNHPPEPEAHANPFAAPELQAAFQMVQRGMDIDRDRLIRSLGLPPHLIGEPRG